MQEDERYEGRTQEKEEEEEEEEEKEERRWWWLGESSTVRAVVAPMDTQPRQTTLRASGVASPLPKTTRHRIVQEQRGKNSVELSREVTGPLGCPHPAKISRPTSTCTRY